jgi:hypothetical protein
MFIVADYKVMGKGFQVLARGYVAEIANEPQMYMQDQTSMGITRPGPHSKIENAKHFTTAAEAEKYRQFAMSGYVDKRGFVVIEI